MTRIRTIFIILIVPGFAFQIQAQNESFLGLTLGTAMPQGTYAEKEYKTEGAGYANTGFLFTFDGTIFPDDYLGIGATVTYGSNNPDKKKYKADLINDVLGRYPGLEDFEENIKFDYGVWKYLNFHIGPAVTIPAGPLNFDLRILGGLSLAWAPDQNFQIFDDTEEQLFSRNIQEKAVPTLGFTAGAGIRYALKGGYVLRFLAEYSNCKPTITTTESIVDAIVEDQEPLETEVAMPIKNIQLSFGIAYNFEL